MTLPQIWDYENIKLVVENWYTYTPDELRGLINLRQYMLKRSWFVSLGGVLWQATNRGWITEDDAKKYKKQAKRRLELERERAEVEGGPVPLSLGWNPVTNKPMFFGEPVIEISARTGKPRTSHKLIIPSLPDQGVPTCQN